MKLHRNALAKLDRHFAEQVERGIRPGYAYSVICGGEVAHASSVGAAELTANVPFRLDTPVRMASLTKATVSVALLMLLEEARLHLFHPVAAYLPAFGNMRVAVARGGNGELETVALRRALEIFDLLTHTSGLGASGQWENPTIATYRERQAEFFACATSEAAASWVATLRLAFQPGDAFGYGYSTDVLARIVELVSGKSLDGFLEERLFGPLGMRRTCFGGAGYAGPALPPVYQSESDGRFSPIDRFQFDQVRFPFAAGGLISTVEDYARFLCMLSRRGRFAGERVLSPAAVDALMRNVLPLALRPIRAEAPVFSAGFGLGVAVVVDEPATPSLLAPGDFFWAGGTDTFFFVSPSRDVGGVICCQYWPSLGTRSWTTWYDFAALVSAAADA